MDDPANIVIGIVTVIGIIALLFAVNPKWGCGGVLALALIIMLFLTTNGLVAIGGTIVLGIVFLFLKFGRGGDINVNVEGYGNDVDINVYR